MEIPVADVEVPDVEVPVAEVPVAILKADADKHGNIFLKLSNEENILVIVDEKALEGFKECWGVRRLLEVCIKVYNRTLRDAGADDFLTTLASNLETELVDETARGYAQDAHNALNIPERRACLNTVKNALAAIRGTGTTNRDILNEVEKAEVLVLLIEEAEDNQQDAKIAEGWKKACDTFAFAYRIH